MERMTKKITSAKGNIFQLEKMVMPVNVGGGALGAHCRVHEREKTALL